MFLISTLCNGRTGMKKKTKTEYKTGDKVVIGGLSPCFFQQSGVVNIESYLMIRVARVNGIAIDETNAFTEEEFLRKCEGYTIEELENIHQYFTKFFGYETCFHSLKIYPLPKHFIAEIEDCYDREFSLKELSDIKKHFSASEVKVGIEIIINYEIDAIKTFITVEKE